MMERMSWGKAVCAAVAALVLMTACSGPGGSGDSTGHASASADTSTSTGPPDVRDVPADAETHPVRHSGDAADDPAIWVDPSDGSRSLVIGNDKSGALETYDLDGSLVQRITTSTSFWGNVDVKQDVRIGGRSTDVVAAANDGIRLYSVDPRTRRLTPLTADGASLDTGGGEGVCLYDGPSGTLSVFMVFISGGVRQFDVHDAGSGRLTLDLVRRFQVGSESEGCVVDDARRALYVDEENVGLWRYGADASSGETRDLVDAVVPRGHQTPDVEGATLVDGGNGAGAVITSSQAPAGGSSYFSAFDRRSGDYLRSFRIVDGSAADGCSHTDGITATSRPLGPRFPQGVFICQDDKNTAPGTSGNQDFKLTRLEKVLPNR
jgi:3-phytase